MKPRSNSEIKLLRRSGQINALALKSALEYIDVGVSCFEIDKLCEKIIKENGGESSFKTVSGYEFTTCITINEEVVHGIPSGRIIKNGDLISVDVGTIFKGWHTDAAWSKLVGQESIPRLRSGQGVKSQEKKKFLSVGEEALWEGIAQAVEGNRIGDISAAIQQKVEGGSYCVVRSLSGHGIGRALHEDPAIPGYGSKGTGLLLKKGMSLAIEVIYNMGKSDVLVGNDGWTISSVDGSLAGLFEMTVIVGKKKAEVLTRLPNDIGLKKVL